MISNSKNKSLIYKNESKKVLKKQKTNEETHRILSIYKSNYSKLDLNDGVEKKKKPKMRLNLHDKNKKKFRKELLKSVNLKRSGSKS
jgi:hypothetical protein